MPLTKEFKKLEKRIEESYLGRPVPTRFKKEFGKKYNLKDIRPLAIKISKSRGIQIDKFKQMGKGVKNE
ncbi:MAG: hypothetical protein U9Q99_00865 [Nanoarchaeota archaeon]|nr:hypothetical protein [Nanoarchaeota archaeon]